MKKQIITLIVATICLSSCQKEDTQLELSADHQATIVNDSTREESQYTHQQILETNLQWTAFITAKVLKNNLSARQEVQNHLQNGQKTIKTNDLLNESNPFFNASFRGYVGFYSSCAHCPEIAGTSPNPPPILGPGHATDSAKFAKYILIENCVELHFPNSLKFRDLFDLTSTGHPLNNYNTNEGLVTLFNEPTFPISETDYQAIHVDVDSNYLETYENIIIARPFRSVSNQEGENGCPYSEYNGIEFTDFLDN